MMNKLVKRQIINALCATSFISLAGIAQADEMATEAAAPAVTAAPASDWTVSSNVGIYSDYIFRGLSFNDHQTTFQGGFDVAHSSGFFAGTYLSSLTTYLNGGNSLEWDVYGGYSHELFAGVTGTVGAVYVGYPQGKNSFNTNTYSYLELNAALAWKGITGKVNYDVTEYSGVPESDGTYYLELAYNNTIPTIDLNYTLHVGRWTQAGKTYLRANIVDANPDYTDWGVSVNKNFKIANSEGWNAGAGITTSNASDGYYEAKPTYDNIGGTNIYAFVKRSF
ncbi:MAG: TorF family putative porin [Methylophilaceae bacterium]